MVLKHPFGYAPINVNPHPPQVRQWVGICSDLSAYFVPRVGAFVQEVSLFLKSL